jgi:hypothetical protein
LWKEVVKSDGEGEVQSMNQFWGHGGVTSAVLFRLSSLADNRGPFSGRNLEGNEWSTDELMVLEEPILPM